MKPRRPPRVVEEPAPAIERAPAPRRLVAALAARAARLGGSSASESAPGPTPGPAAKVDPCAVALEAERRAMSPDAFATEYLCSFGRAGASLFSVDRIQSLILGGPS